MIRQMMVFVAVMSLFVGVFGCKPPVGEENNKTGKPTGGKSSNVSLTGAGASFPYPVYSAWFADFSQETGIKVDYTAVGSSTGIRQFMQQLVDFGASDAAMTNKEIADTKRGAQLLPMTAGAVVVTYNLKEVPDLKLSQDVLSAIFLGQIAKWNDSRIAACNPGVSLPDKPVTVVRRSDGSGTTFVFTGHLSAISPQWKDQIGQGKSVNWPASSVGAPKNAGVASKIEQTDGSIGYVEYGYAETRKLPMATLQNRAGKYVKPGIDSAKAGLASIKLDKHLKGWDYNPASAEAYPIVTMTWIMVYKQYDDQAKGEAIKKLFTWCLTKAQDSATRHGYVPLPKAIVDQSLKALNDNVKCGK